MKARARAVGFQGEPALKPNQPTHSSEAPTIGQRQGECGVNAPLP